LIRILHAADFHLDSPFAALPDEKAAERRREQREQLFAIAEMAAAADITLLSGDLFDSGRAYGETVEALSKALSSIRSEVFIAPGNHDYYAAKSPYARLELPGNVHIFSAPEIRGIELDELGCVVWGRAFTSERSEAPLRGFRVPENGKINVMVLHGDASYPDSPYAYVSRADIEGSGLDYLALGHVHAFSGIQRAGGTIWAYPGCTLGRGFDETGEKGLIAGTVGKDGCELRFVPLGGRRYGRLAVDVSGCETAAEAALAVLGALPEGTERDVYRVALTGRTGGRLRLAEIRAALESRFDYLDLKDEPALGRDVWEAAGEDTLKGNFLRILKSRYDSTADEAEREEIELAARFGLAALEYREDA